LIFFYESIDSKIFLHLGTDKHRLIDVQEKIEALQTFADQLIQSEHYAGQDIEAKKREVLQRWAKLKEALIEKRAQLGESQTLQQFSRYSR
jgi:spectrin alpha